MYTVQSQIFRYTYDIDIVIFILLHMLEANYLTILLKPNYEKAIDTAQDVLDTGLTVLYAPGTESLVETMKNSASNITRRLGERSKTAKVICNIQCYRKIFILITIQDWDEFDHFVQEVIATGSSVVEIGYLLDSELEYGKWHRSKDSQEGINFVSFMLNKKWTLEEEFNNHLLRFQQVTVSYIYFIKLHFHIPGWIDSH